MIFENTSLKMSLHFLLLCALYCFQAPVSNAIPFMYYRSDLSCKINDEWQSCQEEEICENGYEYQFINKKGIESITMDYGLICEKRLSEASIMSIAFFGQLLAFAMAVFYEIPKNQKANVLFVLTFIEGLCLNSLAFIKDSLTWVTIVAFFWNFVFSYLYSQIFTYSSEAYTPSIKEKSVSLINITWTGGALLFIAFSQITGNWIDHLAYFGGSTVWICSIFFYLLSPKMESSSLTNPILQESQHYSDAQLAKQKQNNFIEDLIQKLKELKSNKRHVKNAIIYILGWSIFQLSYATPFIAFNALGGDLQTNVFVSIAFDFIGSIISYYLLLNFDSMRLLHNNFLIIGVIQTVAILFPLDSFGLQLIPILATKLSTRIGYPTMLTLLPFVLPYQYNQLIFNIGNLFSIVLSTFLPFYRYIMEQNKLNIFFGIGVITLVFLPLALKLKTLEDENTEIKQARLSRKRSSFAPIRRNSDQIIEQLLRKSSMIAMNAAQMIIDKQASTDEKIYLNNLKTKNLIELPTIHEIP